MKFEQMMKRLCREVGIDKKTLFTMFLGESAPQKHELESGSKEMQAVTEVINTGVAAQIAYNNMAPSSIDPDHPT